MSNIATGSSDEESADFNDVKVESKVKAKPKTKTKVKKTEISCSQLIYKPGDQYIVIGGVYSINLDRYIDVLTYPSGSNIILQVRMRGSGWLRYLKDSYYRVAWPKEREAEVTAELLRVIEAANRWNDWKLRKPKRGLDDSW